MTQNKRFKNMIAVTNRHLYGEDYFESLKKVIELRPKAIVLREKDLSCKEYTELAYKVKKICDTEDIHLILHFFTDTAIELNHYDIHLPLHIMEKIYSKNIFNIGTSVHSVNDALLADKMNASYIFAGNIYETDCKKGLPGRGLDFLKTVVSSVTIPVYAIGGINESKMPEVLDTGAAGGCMMSGFLNIHN